MADILARLAHSILLAPQGGIPIGDERAARRFAPEHLAPIVARAA